SSPCPPPPWARSPSDRTPRSGPRPPAVPSSAPPPFRRHHHHLRFLGSRASRIDSPSNVKPSATMMMAPAGKTASDGLTSKTRCACASIRPHSARKVSWSPRPRYDRLAASRIAVARVSVACTITGPSALGSMCRNTIVLRLTPSAVAASTWSLSRCASIAPRNSRANTGTLTMPTAMITVHWLLRANSAAMDTARISAGSDNRTSTRRISTLSTQPPSAPAKPPMINPSSRPNNVASTATINVCWEAISSREKKSNPSASLPSTNPGIDPGMCVTVRFSSSSGYGLYGSFGVSHGANAASNMNNATITRPTTATGLRIIRLSASLARLVPPSPAAASLSMRRFLRSSSTCMSAHPHSRVDDRVRDVDQQIDHDVDDRGEQDQRLQPRVVALLDALGEQEAKATPDEHLFRQDRTGQQQPGLQTDRGGDREQRIAQHVPGAHHLRGQPFRLCRTHEVFVQHVQHRRPGDAHDHRERDGGQRDRGQRQVLQRVDRGVELSGQQPVERGEPGHRCRVDVHVLSA